MTSSLPARGIGHSAWQLQYLLAAEQTQAGHQDQVEEQHHGDGQDATLGVRGEGGDLVAEGRQRVGDVQPQSTEKAIQPLLLSRAIAPMAVTQGT